MIGGGISGLAAASRLVQAGRRVVLLEARPRLGGRIHTIFDSATGHAVELGAVFIQGHSQPLFDLIERAGLTLHETPERHERAAGGRRRQLPDAERLVERLLGSPSELEDIPVAELIRRRADRFSAEELQAMTAYLEGFHAADLERFGTAALAENQAAEAEDSGDIGRLDGGYGQLVAQLHADVAAGDGDVRTGMVVTRLRWKPGAVEVDARTGSGGPVRAVGRQAVLAVPLSTLKCGPDTEGAFFPEPSPEGWPAALDRLEIGAAQHIELRFERAWWIRKDRPVPVFVHGQGERIPVWWTAAPPEAPFLTGWAGGPRALSLAGLTVEQLIPIALRSAANIFGVPAERLASSLRAAYSQDWTTDPYARGAYSYGGVGAAGARKLLRRPVAGTLFLTGEALADEGRNATVPGALSSGLSAAAAVLNPKLQTSASTET